MGRLVPRNFPGVLSPRKNDNSMTSDSGQCPSSLTEMEYKPQFFDEPECLSSDKENIPPIESITPPSLKNLSLEEGMTGNETEATSWEASVAKTIMNTPRGKFSLPRQTQHIRTIRTWYGWWNHRYHRLLQRDHLSDKRSPQTCTKICKNTQWLKDTAPHLRLVLPT